MNEREVDQSRRNVLAAMLAAPAAALAGCSGEGTGAEELLGSEASALTTAELQALCNAFYAMSNVVEIRISMPPPDWDSLRFEEPQGGRCSWNFPPGQDRFVWHIATSVTISGSQMPSTPMTYSNVGIKKKSHCGSFHTERPCLKFDFNEFDKHKAELEALIGTSHLLLNNSAQDPSFIRQALAYYFFKQGGLPYSRCNFCKVFVNSNLIGVYVNVEPIRERHIENNFNGLRSGNLYEFELQDDFDANRIQYIDVEKVSAVTNKADLLVAATEIAKGVAGMTKVVDVNQFTKFHAMEFLLKHIDSYNGGIFGRGNNTYVYNDVQAVFNPSADAGNVRFKFIPFGTDYILRPEYNFGVADLNLSSLVGKLVREDASLSEGLRDQMFSYAETVFSRANMDGPVQQFVDQMQTTLASMGAVAVDGTAANVTAGIAEVRQQLGLIRSAAYLMGGNPLTTLYVKDPSTGDCLRASASQRVGSSTTNYEVVHRAFVGDANDRWYCSPSGAKNEGNNGRLHASSTLRTPANHLYVYTTPNNDTNGTHSILVAAEMLHSFCVSGKFTLNVRGTQLYLKFGTDDPTPGTGAQRVYQAAASSATKLVYY